MNSNEPAKGEEKLKQVVDADEENTKKYEGTSRRWAVLAVMCLQTINGCFIYATMSPIAIPLADAFELSTVLYVNWTILIQMFNPVPITFLSVWMFSKYRTDLVIRFAATLILLGAILRAVSYVTESFATVAAG